MGGLGGRVGEGVGLRGRGGGLKECIKVYHYQSVSLLTVSVFLIGSMKYLSRMVFRP